MLLAGGCARAVLMVWGEGEVFLSGIIDISPSEKNHSSRMSSSRATHHQQHEKRTEHHLTILTIFGGWYYVENENETGERAREQKSEKYLYDCVAGAGSGVHI